MLVALVPAGALLDPVLAVRVAYTSQPLREFVAIAIPASPAVGMAVHRTPEKRPLAMARLWPVRPPVEPWAALSPRTAEQPPREGMPAGDAARHRHGRIQHVSTDVLLATAAWRTSYAIQARGDHAEAVRCEPRAAGGDVAATPRPAGPAPAAAA